jgi:hypothetical protein
MRVLTAIFMQFFPDFQFSAAFKVRMAAVLGAASLSARLFPCLKFFLKLGIIALFAHIATNKIPPGSAFGRRETSRIQRSFSDSLCLHNMFDYG